MLRGSGDIITVEGVGCGEESSAIEISEGVDTTVIVGVCGSAEADNAAEEPGVGRLDQVGEISIEMGFVSDTEVIEIGVDPGNGIGVAVTSKGDGSGSEEIGEVVCELEVVVSVASSGGI
jgi:hypothetical protein